MRMTMQATTSRRAPVAPVLALVLAGLLAGCGGGSGEAVGEFEQLVIGPDGGHAEAQNVALVVPPGAFAQDHVCAILEQPDPLPIEPQADGSTIVYHDNIMCIGPLDLALLVPGYLRMCYPLTFPAGAGEDDLVLLEWDAGLGAMRVSTDAVQNLATHCFEDFSYDVLGHVAVGRRIAPPDPVDFDFAFYAEPPVAAAGLPVADTGIVLVDLDGQLATAVVPGTAGVDDYLGNGPGSRVLYRTFVAQTESSTLRTFDVPSLADREVMAPDTFAPSSPLFGWLGFGDTLYYDERDLVLLGVVPLPNAFGTVPGGGGATDRTYPYDGDLFLEDVRISPDGTMALLRFFVNTPQALLERVDVIDVTGTPLAVGLPCDLDFGDPTPRFLPDSSGITFLADDGVTVKRVDPDGANEADLYVLPSAGVLVDFAVAPSFALSPQRCAYVRRDVQVAAAGLPPDGPDYFETDRLTGGDVQSTSIGGPFTIVDLVHVVSENFATSLVGVQVQISRALIDVSGQGLSTALPPSPGATVFFNLFDATIARVIPAPLAWIDFCRQTQPSAHTGKALVAIPFVDTETFPEYPTPGLYVFDPLLTTPTLVTPPGLDMAGPPRWLQSWRHSPGFNPFQGVR